MLPMSEEEIQKLPPPVLLSVIICDTVIIDRITDKPSIIGAFETISPKISGQAPTTCFVLSTDKWPRKG